MATTATAAKWTPEAAGYLSAADGPTLVKHRGRFGVALVGYHGWAWGWAVYDDDGRCVAGRRAFALTAEDACCEAAAALDSLDDSNTNTNT